MKRTIILLEVFNISLTIISLNYFNNYLPIIIYLFHLSSLIISITFPIVSRETFSEPITVSEPAPEPISEPAPEPVRQSSSELVPNPEIRKKMISPIDRETIYKMHMDGYKGKDIAEHYGVSPTYISRIIREEKQKHI